MAEAQPDANGIAPDPSTETDDDGRDGRPGLLVGLRSLDSRALFFVAGCLLLIGLAATGVLSVGSGVEITREESVEIARDHVDFEPENAEARLFRQGFRLVPVWGVSFSIPDENDPNNFERLTTVEVDARTGEVLRVAVDDVDAVEVDE